MFSVHENMFYAGNSEIDQLYKVCSVLGTPSRGDWPDGFVLANGMSFHFPNFSQTHLSQVRRRRRSSFHQSAQFCLIKCKSGRIGKPLKTN